MVLERSAKEKKSLGEHHATITQKHKKKSSKIFNTSTNIKNEIFLEHLKEISKSETL